MNGPTPLSKTNASFRFTILTALNYSRAPFRRSYRTVTEITTTLIVVA